ncbi:MAG: glucose-6-phosphate dehydrogenase [Nitrospirae bacterium]|nr:MAG: glucose-6-phosphate dehydrogenase [Nitrospirota bacterium]
MAEDILPCDIDRAVEPFGLVIFGASGDLARRKLIPSLYNLYLRDALPERFFIVGAARTVYNDTSYRDVVRDSIGSDRGGKVDEFLKHIFYQDIVYDQYDSYTSLKRKLSALSRRYRTGGNLLFYFAVPPSLSGLIIEAVGKKGLNRGRGWVRLVMEKPFGSNLEDARRLNRTVHAYFKEESIFRIDHYLGKETVQDILLFRFANSIFEPLWNRNYIDHVQITAAETIGVGSRAGYYDSTGILRDMFQNHLIQLLSIIALEPPAVFEPKRIREEKVKVFRSLRRVSKDEIPEVSVFGQYKSGRVNGEVLPGYRDEKGIDPNSVTPTFAAIRVFIDNWRWQGVPFYLRSGKRLKRRVTEVSVHFHDLPHSIFGPEIGSVIEPNVLVFRIQPEESIELRFQSKLPGTRLCVREVKMAFSYRGEQEMGLPDAYERVLLDCMRGDHMLFVGQEGVELAWEFFMPFIEFLDGGGAGKSVRFYSPGTWGPRAADGFIRRDGRAWWVK